MVKTRGMIEQRKCAKSAHRKVKAAQARSQADRDWLSKPAAERCCLDGICAAERGCMPCVRMLHRISVEVTASGSSGGSSSGSSDDDDDDDDDDGEINAAVAALLTPVCRRACLLAAREGHRDVLVFVLPLLIEQQDTDTAATMISDLAYFAGAAGHLETMVFLQQFFEATFHDSRSWSTPILCNTLATEGRADCLRHALSAGADWPGRAEFAKRAHQYPYNSPQAECCRIAASSLV